MQIQNFYSDWLPSTSSPLDSIVLSPHTIKTQDFNLTAMNENYCEMESLLCPHDLDHLSPFASSQEKYSCTCQLKKCFNWFRNRCLSRRNT